jgi:3-isopropylmalate dehydratase small subunit
MQNVKGKVWRFGDHIDTDQIIPAERLVAENLDHMGDYVFEKVRPGIASEIGEGDVIIAGRNFGSGSSREHAPRALMQAGISCVIAESFARIFFRNSINVGLLLVECKADTEEGKTVCVDLNGTIRDEDGTEYTFPEYPEFVASLISAGGLMEKIKGERK